MFIYHEIKVHRVDHFFLALTKKHINVIGANSVVRSFLLLLIFAIATPVSAIERKKKILVLHSYHQGLEWTDNITAGIESTFSPHRERYEIYYEYLDTKRNEGKDYTASTINYLLSKNKNIKYEAIITADNNGLDFVKNNYKQLFPELPPIIFCGINDFQQDLIKGIKDVTGVVESINLKSIIDLMRKLHPQRNRILVILDRSNSGNHIFEELTKVMPLFKDEIEFHFNRDFLLEEIPSKVSILGEKDLILSLTVGRERDANFTSYSHAIKFITENASVPVYSAWNFYLGKGIVGGNMASGKLQGQLAAEQTLKILAGESANNLPIIKDNTTKFMFDYKPMKKHGIKYSQLPPDSSVINMPPGLYEKYKTQILVTTIIALLSTIILLLKYIRQKIALKAQHALNLKLDSLVQKRTKKLKLINDILKEKIIELFRAKQKITIQKQRYHSLVSNIPGAVYRCYKKESWEMLYISNSIEDISKYPASDFINNKVRTFSSIIHPEDKPDAKKIILDSLEQKKPYVLEYRIIDSTGNIRWIYENGQGMFRNNGQAEWIDGVIFDVTKHKQLEQLKNDVEMMMRHDLKNPLGNIMIFQNLLEKLPQLNEDEKKWVECIGKSGNQMQKLIEMPLDLFKMETGRYDFCPTDIDIVKILKETTVQEFSTSKNEINFQLFINGKEVQEDDAVYIKGEEHLCYEMFCNLILNAKEASQEGDVISISICTDNTVDISIHNTAPVPEKVRSHFFEKYRTEGKAKGTGLGTYSAKLIAETQGATISMQTSEEDGTSVTLSFPK